MVKCTKCGSEADDKAVFCSKCGAKITSGNGKTFSITPSVSVDFSGEMVDYIKVYSPFIRSLSANHKKVLREVEDTYIGRYFYYDGKVVDNDFLFDYIDEYFDRSKARVDTIELRQRFNEFYEVASVKNTMNAISKWNLNQPDPEVISNLISDFVEKSKHYQELNELYTNAFKNLNFENFAFGNLDVKDFDWMEFVAGVDITRIHDIIDETYRLVDVCEAWLAESAVYIYKRIVESGKVKPVDFMRDCTCDSRYRMNEMVWNRTKKIFADYENKKISKDDAIAGLCGCISQYPYCLVTYLCMDLISYEPWGRLKEVARFCGFNEYLCLFPETLSRNSFKDYVHSQLEKCHFIF